MVTIYRDNRPTRCHPALLAMFEDRKRLFIDLLGWSVPVIESRYEVDQFDDEHCIYLLDGDADDAHLGSLRLLPTTRPHLLDTMFACLCDGSAPIGASVWEITRLCLPQRLGAARRLAVRNRLISAMVDHALENGIDILTGVVEASFRAQVLEMGWRCAPLGAPARIGDHLLGAFRIELGPDTPMLLMAAGIYAPSMAFAPCPLPTLTVL